MTTEAQRAAIAGLRELMAAVGVAASKLLLTERQYQIELVRWSEFPDKPLPNHDGVKNARYNFNSACAAVEAAAVALVEQRDVLAAAIETLRTWRDGAGRLGFAAYDEYDCHCPYCNGIVPNGYMSNAEECLHDADCPLALAFLAAHDAAAKGAT